ncbi:MAG: FkbM family methyltransferase [Cryomorphaceae bacterium]
MIRLIKQIRYRLKYLTRDLVFWYAAHDGPLYRWIALNRYRPEQGSVESFIDAFSKASYDFYLIQVGANDGMTHDPVYKFIKRDRWNAILFEPQPSVFKRYLQPVYRKYPLVKPINAAIGYEDGAAELYTISFNSDRWATGLATFERSVLLAAIKDGKLDRRLDRYGIIAPEDPEDWIAAEEIRVRSFQSVMQEHGVKRIDLLMIDTEGFDHEVIKMVDFAVVKPAAIVFEDSHISEPDYEACVRRLQEHGYTTHRIGPNTVAWLVDIRQFVPWD